MKFIRIKIEKKTIWYWFVQGNSKQFTDESMIRIQMYCITFKVKTCFRIVYVIFFVKGHDNYTVIKYLHNITVIIIKLIIIGLKMKAETLKNRFKTWSFIILSKQPTGNCAVSMVRRYKKNVTLIASRRKFNFHHDSNVNEATKKKTKNNIWGNKCLTINKQKQTCHRLWEMTKKTRWKTQLI